MSTILVLSTGAEVPFASGVDVDSARELITRARAGGEWLRVGKKQDALIDPHAIVEIKPAAGRGVSFQ
jgi:hypothetical protein